MDKHDTAVELLASTEQQRSVAAEQLQRRIAQCERVKVKVEKVHLMLLGRTKNGIIMGKSKCPWRFAKIDGTTWGKMLGESVYMIG